MVGVLSDSLTKITSLMESVFEWLPMVTFQSDTGVTVSGHLATTSTSVIVADSRLESVTEMILDS